MMSILALVFLAPPLFDNDIPEAAREAFEKATQLELYSLDPSLGRKDENAEGFHGWKVLGTVSLKGADAKSARLTIEKGRRESQGVVAACFNPRHGLRIVHEKKTFDFVICYECLSAEVYEEGRKIGQFLTTAGPAAALNKILRDAKVPLPQN